jgi:hypothetical protein
MSEPFEISDAVRAWADEHGFGAHLEAHREQFVGYAKANAAVYADWDQAFMNAIRGDWGNVRKRAGQGAPRPSSSTELTADETFR